LLDPNDSPESRWLPLNLTRRPDREALAGLLLEGIPRLAELQPRLPSLARHWADRAVTMVERRIMATFDAWGVAAFTVEDAAAKAAPRLVKTMLEDGLGRPDADWLFGLLARVAMGQLGQLTNEKDGGALVSCQRLLAPPPRSGRTGKGLRPRRPRQDGGESND
jgi:hypothetical protein